MDEGAETKKGRLFGLRRLVLAVAILAWIARALPWNDNLTWHDGAGDTDSAFGEIEGAYVQAGDDCGQPPNASFSRTRSRSADRNHQRSASTAFNYAAASPRPI